MWKLTIWDLPSLWAGHNQAVKSAENHSTGSDAIALLTFHYDNWGESDGILRYKKVSGFLCFSIIYTSIYLDASGWIFSLLNKDEELLLKERIE